jgi:hypothetical protein
MISFFAKQFPIHSLLLLVVGCAPSAHDIVEEWKAKGWTIVDVLGTEGSIKRHGKLMSDQAQAVEASWVEKGRRKTKVYPQKRDRILVLRFFKDDDDQFAVVMKKRK